MYNAAGAATGQAFAANRIESFERQNHLDAAVHPLAMNCRLVRGIYGDDEPAATFDADMVAFKCRSPAMDHGAAACR